MLSLLTPLLARAHQEALLEEAKGNQMVARAGEYSPRLEERVLVRLGAWLVSIGLRLQARYRPEMRTAPGACGSACS